MSNSATRTFCILGTAGFTIAAVATSPAYAQTTTSSLSVSATVPVSCSVSMTAVSFGDVNVVLNANVDATGDLTVTCTSGTVWSASADAGLGTGASTKVRKMISGANLLDYALYTESTRTSVWGDGTGGTAKFIGTGTGSAQSNVIYARIPSGQITVPAGSYADTVTVTLTY